MRSCIDGSASAVEFAVNGGVEPRPRCVCVMGLGGLDVCLRVSVEREDALVVAAVVAAGVGGVSEPGAAECGSAYLTGVLPGQLRTGAQADPGCRLRRPGCCPHPGYRP